MYRARWNASDGQAARPLRHVARHLAHGQAADELNAVLKEVELPRQHLHPRAVGAISDEDDSDAVIAVEQRRGTHERIESLHHAEVSSKNGNEGVGPAVKLAQPHAFALVDVRKQALVDPVAHDRYFLGRYSLADQVLASTGSDDQQVGGAAIDESLDKFHIARIRKPFVSIPESTAASGQIS